MSKSVLFDKAVIGSEASFGTIATSLSAIPKIQSGNITSSQEFLVDTGVGNGLNNTNAYYGPYSCSGSLSTYLTSFDLLKHWVGPRSGSGTPEAPYILTEHQGVGYGATELPSFSIRVGNDDGTDDVWTQVGCVGSDFSISADLNGKLSFSGNWTGQKTKYKAETLSYTPDTNPAMIMIGGNYKIGSSPATLSGVQSFTLNYSSNINYDGGRHNTSRFINKPSPGIRGYTLSVDIIMSNSLASSIYGAHLGDVSSVEYIPNDGSTNSNPNLTIEFEINVINSNMNGIIQLDSFLIQSMSIPISLGNGLKLVSLSCIALKGRDKQPFKYWS